jgi:hypothetical protein
MASLFAAHELKNVTLEELKDAASTIHIAGYGAKKDIASRIAGHKGGKSIVKNLISTSLKRALEKETGKRGGPKATIMKKERVRLVASGETEKKKIKEKLQRLWASQRKKNTSDKKTEAKAPATKSSAAKMPPNFVNSRKLLPDAACIARNLTLVGSDSSSGTTWYKYKVNNKPTKGSCINGKCTVNPDAATNGACGEDASDDDESYSSDDDEKLYEKVSEDVEARATSRILGKKIKREHINGVLEGYGVDASAWTTPQAKAEMILQMFNETDDDDSDDEEEEDDAEEDGDDEN